MIVDDKLYLSEAQALTATAISEDVMPLSPLHADNLGLMDLGTGQPLYGLFTVGTALDSAGEGATLIVSVESSAVEALTSATVHYTSATLAEATLVAGYQFAFVLTPGQLWKEFVGFRYTVGVESFTSGTVYALLTPDINVLRQYASGLVFGF